MSEAAKMFVWVMGFTTLLGGPIWFFALCDHVVNHNPSAMGPLVGIPLGLVVWSPAVWIVCQYVSHPGSPK